MFLSESSEAKTYEIYLNKHRNANSSINFCRQIIGHIILFTILDVNWNDFQPGEALSTICFYNYNNKTQNQPPLVEK